MSRPSSSSPSSKAVRFAHSDTVVPTDMQTTDTSSASPVPRATNTPSPSRSTSTISTDGPATPPSVVRKTMASRPTNPEEILLHACILDPTKAWDVVEDPSKVEIPELELFADEDALISDTKAFESVKLVSDKGALKIPIKLKINGRKITVHEFYISLHKGVMAHADEKVFDGLTNEMKKAVLAAYHKRCEERNQVRVQEPLRWVDYLQGRFYTGLCLREGILDTYKLLMSDAPSA